MKILNRLEPNLLASSTRRSESPLAGHDRQTRSTTQPSSIVRLHGTPSMPALYGADGVATTAAGPGLLAQLRQRLSDEYPDLRAEARQAVESRLRRDYHVEVDADHTYFDTFARADSSSLTFNGWEHEDRPINSISLTDMQLRNFPADFGEDPNGLNANTGIYRADDSAYRFDTRNEVRLLSSELKQAIRSNDFQAAYRARLAAYWDRNESAVALHYEALALEHSQDGSLSDAGRKLLAQAAGYHTAGDTTWKAFAFDINTYASKNMAWLQAADGRVVLFTPHGAKPLREYANVDDMRRGIAAMVRTEAGRDEILRGFSIYNQQDGVIYQGVEKWLGDIAAGGYDDRIARRQKPVEGKLFDVLAHQSRLASLDDTARLVRSNADIGKQETMQALQAFNDIMGSTMTQVVEAGYALYAARTEGLQEDRRDAASRAWASGVGAAVMLLLDGAGRQLAAAGPIEPSVVYKPPTRLPDGRVGYPLGPVGAPRIPEGEGLPGTSGARRTASPDPIEPLDLSVRRVSNHYREPAMGLAGPHRDIPSPGPVSLHSAEPLDLSMSAQPATLPAAPVPAVSPVAGHPEVVHTNALGFRERTDFNELYGYQSFGGARRHAAVVAGLEVNRHPVGIAPMVEGDMLRTFSTAEEANASAQRANFQRYQIYRIRSAGLRAASLSDNKANNPLFESMLVQMTPLADQIGDARLRSMRRIQLMRDAEHEIHLSTDHLRPELIEYFPRQRLDQ